ncbi:MAG: site-2 protease family protein [Candidatus Eremiobacteraeota bacterium]|nr:site-2 protease family protein [Candidatus Eremiobacteraeota bacterium]
MSDPNDPNANIPTNPYTSRWSAERPVEGSYEPPKEEGKSNALKTAGGTAVGIGLLAAKFKGLLLLLLNFKWILIAFKGFAFAGTFLLSFWFYTLFWGWKFALALVLLLAIHEFGHYFAMRFFGVPASLPFFVPFMGALVTMKGTPPSAFHESIIALAGPFMGTLASAGCALIGSLTGDPFWYATASFGFFMNLFNMAPVMPLDGGRIVGSLSPRIWVGGLVLFVIAIFAFHLYNPLLILLILVSLPQVWAAWKGNLDSHYYDTSVPHRILIGTSYFVLAGILFAGMMATQVPVPHHHTIVQ